MHGAAVEVVGGRARAAADEGAHTGKHLLHMERFGDVIVRARVDACHLVAPTVAGGEDQDRHRPPLLSPRLQQRQSVHLRQTEIEDDGVIRLGLAEIVAFFPVEGAIHGVARPLQGLAELTVEVPVVLDDEQSHGLFALT